MAMQGLFNNIDKAGKGFLVFKVRVIFCQCRPLGCKYLASAIYTVNALAAISIGLDCIPRGCSPLVTHTVSFMQCCILTQDFVRMLYPNATESNVRQLMSMARDQKAAYKVMMTPERIREMKATFKECDTDGSGDVSRSEFVEGIQNAGGLRTNDIPMMIKNVMHKTSCNRLIPLS